MNQKGVVQLEIEKNGRMYTFSMPIGAPFGECYDAAYACSSHILEMAKQAMQKQEEVPSITEEQS